MKLNYSHHGDYPQPDLGLTEAEQRPLGKHGRMRLRYLEAHRPINCTHAFCSPASSWNTHRKSAAPAKNV